MNSMFAPFWALYEGYQPPDETLPERNARLDKQDAEWAAFKAAQETPEAIAKHEQNTTEPFLKLFMECEAEFMEEQRKESECQAMMHL